jgi:hypothetical protein
MTQARKVTLGAAILLLALLIASQQLWKNRSVATLEENRYRPHGTHAATAAEPTEDDQRSGSPSASKQSVLDDWAALLKWLDSSPRPTEQEVRSRLFATRLSWTQMDPQERAAGISELLESGTDATTGLDFKVGPHGLLVGWPTLRVFLLDILATSDPEMAIATASKLLDTTTSGDEFAIALRSLTRDGMGRAEESELLDRFDQMLGHRDWQTSRGFAEAFDLARFIGTREAALRLTAWEGNPQLKSMAMDEFTAEHPQEMMEILHSESTVSGASRASIMARADPSNSKQLDSVDAYLHRPNLSPEEASTFLKSFPLRSATTGYRLYGKTPAPYTYEQIKAGDLAASKLLENWTADPTLEKFRPELLSLQTRLTKWVQQAR